MDCSTPSLPVHHQLPEPAQTHVHWVGNAIQTSYPLSSLLLLPLIFPSIRVFSNQSVLHIRWPKYWSFSISKAIILQLKNKLKKKHLKPWKGGRQWVWDNLTLSCLPKTILLEMVSWGWAENSVELHSWAWGLQWAWGWGDLRETGDLACMWMV